MSERDGALRKLGRVVFVLTLVIALPLLAERYLPIPWSFILGSWAALLVTTALRHRRARFSALKFNVGVALLVLALGEVGLAGWGPVEFHWSLDCDGGAYMQDDEDLGWSLVPRARCRSACFYRDELVHEATYSVNRSGWRETPGAPLGDAVPVAFFGCSFMYGHGLEDGETIPAVVERASGGRLEGYNFALDGYGPNHMLALLESGRAQAALPEAPGHVVYLAMWRHPHRILDGAGRIGPRYRRDGDGGVQRCGRLSTPYLRARLGVALGKSNIYRLMEERLASYPIDAPLMADIVHAARERVQAMWPGCTFHVLLWDGGRPQSAAVQEALERRGLRVHLVSAVLPGFSTRRTDYELHARDQHPNAKAALGIGEWMVDSLLQD